jgi:hypothetical protein
MLTVLNLIAAVIAIWSGILGVISFTRLKWKYGRLWMIASFVSAVVVVLLTLREDANRVASSMTLSGWENAGDHLAYLAAAAGFYARPASQMHTPTPTQVAPGKT